MALSDSLDCETGNETLASANRYKYLGQTDNYNPQMALANEMAGDLSQAKWQADEIFGGPGYGGRDAYTAPVFGPRNIAGNPGYPPTSPPANVVSSPPTAPPPISGPPPSNPPLSVRSPATNPALAKPPTFDPRGWSYPKDQKLPVDLGAAPVWGQDTPSVMLANGTGYTPGWEPNNPNNPLIDWINARNNKTGPYAPKAPVNASVDDMFAETPSPGWRFPVGVYGAKSDVLS